MRLLSLTIFVFLSYPIFIFAELEWEADRIEYSADLDETQFESSFRFKNTGDTVVEIVSVKTSCGCTTAELNKRKYEPNESGEIPFSFKYGSRKGLQNKKIRVETTAGEYVLNLRVLIPKLVTVEPRLLLWRAIEVDEWKTITVTSDLENIINVSYEAKNLTGWEIIKENSERGFIIKIKPSHYESRRILTLTLNIELEAGRNKKEIVYLRMI